MPLLQALVWSGQTSAARDEAASYLPSLGRWGSNRHLELLVQTCLQPAAETGEMTQAEAVLPPARRVLFRLHDTGFTRVALQRVDDAGTTVTPLTWRGRFWEIEVPLAPGEHPYRFIVEGTQPLPDPEATLLEERVDGLWSRILVSPVPGS